MDEGKLDLSRHVICVCTLGTRIAGLLANGYKSTMESTFNPGGLLGVRTSANLNPEPEIPGVSTGWCPVGITNWTSGTGRVANALRRISSDLAGTRFNAGRLVG